MQNVIRKLNTGYQLFNFSNTIYVKVSKDKLWVRQIETGKEMVISAIEPFTTKRLLVGNFLIAEKYLKDAVNKVRKNNLFSPSPIFVMQPLEMYEGGLSDVEERVLRELALGAGGRDAVIWNGHELSDNEVMEQAKKRITRQSRPTR